MTANSQLAPVIDMLKRLVEAESPSSDKAAVDRLGKIVAAELRTRGGKVAIHPRQKTGDLVEACWSPGSGMVSRKDKPKKILLLCHMDTVFPVGTLEKVPFREENERLYGPGVSDMKGGIVVALEAISRLMEKGIFPCALTALFTPDEEIGSHASLELLVAYGKNSDLVLVMEPGLSDGALKTWRKGVGEFHIHIHGRAAHAGGDHEKGRNAIEEMSHQVLTVQRLTDYQVGTTVNVGVIHGGIATNVVPDEVVASVDVRVMNPNEAKRITKQLFELKPVLEGTTVSVTGEVDRPPMPFDDTMKSTFEKARSIARSIGIDLVASGTGGASDANFIAQLGIPVLDGLGPAGGEYHSDREYIVKASIQPRIELLSALLQEW